MLCVCEACNGVWGMWGALCDGYGRGGGVCLHHPVIVRGRSILHGGQLMADGEAGEGDESGGRGDDGGR